MKLEETLARIPYIGLHGLEVRPVDENAVEARMPLRPELANYVGTAHAGALFTAAETAAGAAAYGIVAAAHGFALLRAARVQYTRPAESAVLATASVDPERAAATREAFAAGGRANLEIGVRSVDAEGEAVFEGTFEYALRPAGKPHEAAGKTR